MKPREILLIVISLAISLSLTAGHKIEINIKGLDPKIDNDSIILGLHYGNSKKGVDKVAVVDGKAIFEGSKALIPGMYLVVYKDELIFDFLISDTIAQTFSITVNKGKYLESMTVKGSEENSQFVEFSRFTKNIREEERKLHEDKLMSIEEKRKIQSELQTKQIELINKINSNFKGTLLASIANATNFPMPPEPNVPDTASDKDIQIARYYFQYEKDHMWDNINLNDSRMVYTPVLELMLERYLEHLTPKIPDSVNSSIDILLKKVKDNPEITKHFAGLTFNKYMNSDIMGMESVPLHLIDDYYLKGEVTLENDSVFMEKIREWADKNRHLMIGQKAPDLKLESITGDYESLYDIDAPYVVVYIYESNCGHCKEETPRLFNVYKQFKDKGLKVFAVYSQRDKKEWQEYVAKNNLDWINVWDPKNQSHFRIKYNLERVPQLFLLDKNKIIIGRRLSSPDLSRFLNQLINKNNKENED